jgi:hypothetical protein
MKHQRYQPTSRPGSTAPHGTSRSLLLSTVFLLLVFKTTPGFGNEWNCVSTSGTYVKSADCAPMSGQVVVDGDLSISGNENTYTTLVAASGARHFLLDSGTPTLVLRWLNMTDGAPTSEHGGSIFVEVGGHLNVTHCVFYKNSVGSAKWGGAIYASNINVLVSLTNTKFIENSAAYVAGAVFLSYGTLHSQHVQYLRNSAEYGGALRLNYLKDGSTLDNDLFAMNEAKYWGGHFIRMVKKMKVMLPWKLHEPYSNIINKHQSGHKAITEGERFIFLAIVLFRLKNVHLLRTKQ